MYFLQWHDTNCRHMGQYTGKRGKLHESSRFNQLRAYIDWFRTLLVGEWESLAGWLADAMLLDAVDIIWKWLLRHTRWVGTGPDIIQRYMGTMCDLYLLWQLKHVGYQVGHSTINNIGLRRRYMAWPSSKLVVFVVVMLLEGNQPPAC